MIGSKSHHLTQHRAVTFEESTISSTAISTPMLQQKCAIEQSWIFGFLASSWHFLEFFAHQTIIPHRVAINCCVTPTWPFRAAQCSAVRPKLAVGRLWKSKLGDFRSCLLWEKLWGNYDFAWLEFMEFMNLFLFFYFGNLHTHQFRNLFKKNNFAVKQV